MDIFLHSRRLVDAISKGVRGLHVRYSTYSSSSRTVIVITVIIIVVAAVAVAVAVTIHPKRCAYQRLSFFHSFLGVFAT
jgi:uncharacterized membrane protein